MATMLSSELSDLGCLNGREIAAPVGVAPLNRDIGQYRGLRSVWSGHASVRIMCHVLSMITVTATQFPACGHTSHPCKVSPVPYAQAAPVLGPRLSAAGSGPGAERYSPGTQRLCQDSAAAVLEAHRCFEMARRKLREWTCDDADRILPWGPAQEVEVTACCLELLC